MGDDELYRDDPSELDELRNEWEAVFGDGMPWGFGIGYDQIPILRQCIAERSKEPLRTYWASQPAGTVF